MRIALLKEKYHPHISLTDTIGALTKMKRGIGLCSCLQFSQKAKIRQTLKKKHKKSLKKIFSYSAGG